MLAEKVPNMAKGKHYTEEFKREAVRLLVTRGEQPASAISKSLGVAESQLYQWRKQFRGVEETAVNGRGESNALVAHRRRRFRVTTTSDHDSPIAPHLLKQNFTASGPDQVWVGDITLSCGGHHPA